MTDNRNGPWMTRRDDQAPTTTSSSDIDSFLAEIRSRTPSTSNVRGRLIFGLDATASRQPTWDTACQLQAEMFREAATTGGLDVQLVYYRGLGECRSSRWFSSAEQLAKAMSQIMCTAGQTQIEKILTHVQKETKLLRVNALVFVGDALEENPDKLSHDAGELGRLGVPAFMFQEGHDRDVEQVFRGIARLTHGAYCRFDPGAARQLAELLRAVAVYAAGGMTALAARRDAGAVKLLSQMK
jgi:hypothetical protein